jgi:hypothetical protein
MNENVREANPLWIIGEIKARFHANPDAVNAMEIYHQFIAIRSAASLETEYIRV